MVKILLVALWQILHSYKTTHN